MIIGDWAYYNHAWIPKCAPHVVPDLTPLNQGELFKHGGVFARYVTEFDCQQETDWWYVIKDKVFDINTLKAKRRYVIKQGEKNFDVKIIDPRLYKEQIARVTEQAFSVYPAKYRPQIIKENIIQKIEQGSWSRGGVVYGAFRINSEDLQGYAIIEENDEYIEFSVQKTNPEYEKWQINAALVYKIVLDYSLQISQGKYICDGARNIQHQTNFPEYLEKYFGFRKAYCKLHIVYAPKYKVLIKFLYPLRKVFGKLDFNKKIHQLNGVLLMEEIVRKQNQ